MRDKPYLVRSLKVRDENGVALIITVGILATMAIVAVSFAINMQLEQKGAVNYLNSVKARYLAEVGVYKTAADIRKWVKTADYSTLKSKISSMSASETALDDIGTYSVKVEDESAKVNINTFTENASNGSDDSIDKLRNAGLTDRQIANIIDYRDYDSVSSTVGSSSGRETSVCKNAPFSSVEEVCLVADVGREGYDKIKNVITIFEPVVRGGLRASYYKAVGGFSFPRSSHLGTIVELGQLRRHDMPGSESAEERGDAEFAGSYLMNKKSGNDWRLDNFGVIYEGYIEILPSEVGNIPILLTANDNARLYIEGKQVSGNHNFTRAGWYALRIEYYDLSGENTLELKWKSGEYVPAERLGFTPPTDPDVAYNSGGYYKIISTGKVKARDGSVLAEKKVSTVVKLFGVWMQTTRSEFSAPWASEYNDFSDGELKNVTWLDSCPTDTDESAGGGGMKWEQSWNPSARTAEYETINDSLKLGYWDNFEEDVAYSVVNIYKFGSTYMSDAGVTSEDGSGWTVSYDEFEGDGQKTVDNQFNIYCNTRTSRIAEVNTNYYFSYNSDIFGRAREEDYGYDPGTATWGHSPSERKSSPPGIAFEPEAQWLGGYFSVKKDSTGPTYNVFVGDACVPYYWGADGQDYFEIFLKYPDWMPYVGCTYTQRKVLGFIMSEEDYDYSSYLNGDFKVNKTGSSDSQTQDIIRFHHTNSADSQWWVEEKLITTRIGASSPAAVYFDNVRVIFKEGYFVSTPFYTGLDDIIWGIISWNDEENGEGYTPPDNTTLKLYTRTADGRTNNFPTTDTGFSEVSSGSSVSGTGNWIQYKAMLTSEAIDKNDYAGSSATPVLKNITVTYLPDIEVLSWREIPD